MCIFKRYIWGGEKLSLNSVLQLPEEERFCSEATNGGGGRGSRYVGVPGDPVFGDALAQKPNSHSASNSCPTEAHFPSAPLVRPPSRCSPQPCPSLFPPLPAPWFGWRSIKKGDSPFHYSGGRWRAEERYNEVLDIFSCKLNNTVRTTLYRKIGLTQ